MDTLLELKIIMKIENVFISFLICYSGAFYTMNHQVKYAAKQ